MLEKLGVTVAWQGCTIEGLTAIASEADRLGFGYFWVPEAWGMESFSTISHVMNKTSRIRIGVGIANVYSRSAALIGMACATFDQIAPGRFLLGLGSSGRAVIENWHGSEFSNPLKRTEEYVQVIRKVASGEEVEFNGEVLNLSRFRLFTKPVSNLEIYLGAIGDANLRLAGKICEGAILAQYPTSKLGRALELLSGKSLFTYLPTHISTSKEELAGASLQVAKMISFYITSMGKYYSRNLARLGYEEDVNRIVEAHFLGSKAFSDVVGEKLIEELSLVGDPHSIVERVSKLPDLVIPVFAFGARSSDEVKSAINSMRLFAS